MSLVTNPPALISVINQSTRVTDAELAQMVSAIGIQLARDVSPIYGRTPALELVPTGQPYSGIPCYVQDTPDVPGAAGYHDEDGDGSVTGVAGTPYIKVFTSPTLDNGGTVLSGANSVSVTLSHEVLELVGDTPANKWADGPDGADYAFELCDAVEGDSYDVQADDGTNVAVSNFVYPEFFDPKAPQGAKFDQMGRLSAPFSMTSGGYEIRRTEPGQTSQVFASHPHRGSLIVLAVEGLALLFGPSFPTARRAAKVETARRRRA